MLKWSGSIRSYNWSIETNDFIHAMSIDLTTTKLHFQWYLNWDHWAVNWVRSVEMGVLLHSSKGLSRTPRQLKYLNWDDRLLYPRESIEQVLSRAGLIYPSTWSHRLNGNFDWHSIDPSPSMGHAGCIDWTGPQSVRLNINDRPLGESSVSTNIPSVSDSLHDFNWPEALWRSAPWVNWDDHPAEYLLLNLMEVFKKLQCLNG